jgi:hypothetical protein
MCTTANVAELSTRKEIKTTDIFLLEGETTVPGYVFFVFYIVLFYGKIVSYRKYK